MYVLSTCFSPFYLDVKSKHNLYYSALHRLPIHEETSVAVLLACKYLKTENNLIVAQDWEKGTEVLLSSAYESF